MSYILKVLVIPLIISILPLTIKGGYGPDVVTCWVDEANFLFIEVIYYIPLFLVFIFNIGYYVKTWRFLSQIFDDVIK